MPVSIKTTTSANPEWNGECPVMMRWKPGNETYKLFIDESHGLFIFPNGVRCDTPKGSHFTSVHSEDWEFCDDTVNFNFVNKT